MKCCANCEWIISPELEMEIMEEQSYKENDLTRPVAGDCALGIDTNGEYVCSQHIYADSGLETDMYYGNGSYYIVCKFYDEIIKYMKLMQVGKEGPLFKVQAFDEDFNLQKQQIDFEIDKNNIVFPAFEVLASKLGSNKILDEDNYLQFLLGNYGVQIIINMCNSKKIDIGYSNQYYELLRDFYNMLTNLNIKKLPDNEMKKMMCRR